MRKCGLASLDDGDALTLTFAYPVVKRDWAEERRFDEGTKKLKGWMVIRSAAECRRPRCGGRRWAMERRLPIPPLPPSAPPGGRRQYLRDRIANDLQSLELRKRLPPQHLCGVEFACG